MFLSTEDIASGPGSEWVMELFLETQGHVTLDWLVHISQWQEDGFWQVTESRSPHSCPGEWESGWEGDYKSHLAGVMKGGHLQPTVVNNKCKCACLVSEPCPGWALGKEPGDRLLQNAALQCNCIRNIVSSDFGKQATRSNRMATS